MWTYLLLIYKYLLTFFFSKVHYFGGITKKLCWYWHRAVDNFGEKLTTCQLMKIYIKIPDEGAGKMSSQGYVYVWLSVPKKNIYYTCIVVMSWCRSFSNSNTSSKPKKWFLCYVCISIWKAWDFADKQCIYWKYNIIPICIYFFQYRLT